MDVLIDEALERFKIEILAQDWRLSQKRIELMQASLACFKQHYRDRKSAYAILVMAGNVLSFVQRKRADSPPETVDFIKEAIAHVVSLYEDLEFDPEKEKRVFNSCFRRFCRLKEKIQGKKADAADKTSDAELADDVIFSPPEGPLDFSLADVELQGLQKQLDDAARQLQAVTEAFSQLVADLRRLPTPETGAVLQPEEDEPAVAPEAEEFGGPAPDDDSEHVLSGGACLVEINGLTCGVPENRIATIKKISAARRTGYLGTREIPLKDFKRLFRSLSSEFPGILAQQEIRKLEQLSLPLMQCQGSEDLPAEQDGNGEFLVLVSWEQRCGFFLCSRIHDPVKTVANFTVEKCGDRLGLLTTDDGTIVPVIDLVAVLQREGCLIG